MDTNSIKNVGIGAGVLLIAYTAFSYFKKKKDADTPGTDAFSEEAIKSITVDPKKLVKDKFYYKNVAEQLYNELKKHVPLTNIFTYDSKALFGYIPGLNNDELKQVAKEFGVRSLMAFDLIKMPDGGTLFEWFDNILSKTDLEKMRAVWAGTGLWQTTADPSRTAYTNYLDSWMKNRLDAVKYPNARLNTGNKVYSIYTGNNKLGFTDGGWFDINSYLAKAKGGIADFFVRPDSANIPLGTITNLYKATSGTDTGKVFLIKVKLTHPKLHYTGNTPLANREVWLLPSRLTDQPYNPPLSGLPALKTNNYQLSNVL